jgi:hypothetical protein
MSEDRMDRMEEALRRIVEWADAYPLKVFPEPDEPYLTAAHETLVAAGLPGIDRISASAMRHVITQVGKIAADALRESPT